MKKYVLLITLILLIGCQGLKTSNLPIGNNPGVLPSFSGSDGLSGEFLENSGNLELLEGWDASVIFKLTNAGGADASDILLTLQGLNNQEFYFPRSIPLQRKELTGMTLETPFEDQEITQFTIQNVKLPVGHDSYKTSFVVRMEYDYETKLSTEICINPKTTGTFGLEECEPERELVPPSQKAPVTISRIIALPKTSQNRKKEMQYIISIANSGQGDVIGNFALETAKIGKEEHMECYKGTDTQGAIIGSDLGIFPVEYTGSGKEEKEIIITCVQELENEAAYTSLFSFHLRYRYGKSVEGKIAVKSPDSILK